MQTLPSTKVKDDVGQNTSEESEPINVGMHVTDNAAYQRRGRCHSEVRLRNSVTTHTVFSRAMYGIISDFQEQIGLSDEGVAYTR